MHICPKGIVELLLGWQTTHNKAMHRRAALTLREKKLRWKKGNTWIWKRTMGAGIQRKDLLGLLKVRIPTWTSRLMTDRTRLTWKYKRAQMWAFRRRIRLVRELSWFPPLMTLMRWWTLAQWTRWTRKLKWKSSQSLWKEWTHAHQPFQMQVKWSDLAFLFLKICLFWHFFSFVRGSDFCFLVWLALMNDYQTLICVKFCILMLLSVS